MLAISSLMRLKNMQNTENAKEFDGWLKVPALYYLSGLTCTDDNVRTKAGAQRYAAEHGIALVMPDTSPRGDDVADNPDRYDLGKGAGFYVNATQEPWAPHYQMFDYVSKELPALVEANLPVSDVKSISGHSMGGHGAMIVAMKNAGAYQSVSAFAPIANPVNCQWGEDCLGAYLGDDRATWQEWDSTALIESGVSCPPLMVDQGGGDNFLESQLNYPVLEAACKSKNLDATLRMQPDYDHSYHFIASFIGEHIAFHAKHLFA